MPQGGYREGAKRPPKYGKTMTGTVKVRVPSETEDDLRQAVYDLRDGNAAIFAIDPEIDWPLVAWLREQASTHRELEDSLVGLANAIERAIRLQTQRDIDEFRALVDDYSDGDPNDP